MEEDVDQGPIEMVELKHAVCTWEHMAVSKEVKPLEKWPLECKILKNPIFPQFSKITEKFQNESKSPSTYNNKQSVDDKRPTMDKKIPV